jgi:hypothetical protein
MVKDVPKIRSGSTLPCVSVPMMKMSNDAFMITPAMHALINESSLATLMKASRLADPLIVWTEPFYVKRHLLH